MKNHESAATDRNSEFEALRTTLRSIAAKLIPDILREPSGNFRHPYREPGACYRRLIWDWDGYFCALALDSMGWGGEAIRGTIDIFLENQGPDGAIPFRLMAEGGNSSQRIPLQSP
jgi:hypothetical protein